MDWFVRRFIKSAPVLGFVTMMIYGVGYHVVPRFFGHPLHSKRLGGAHWWVSNAGLALMVVGFVLAPNFGKAGIPVLATGGVLSALGAFAFIYNVWRTIGGPAALGRVAAAPQSRRPPLVTE